MKFPKNHKSITIPLFNLRVWAFNDRKSFAKACNYIRLDGIKHKADNKAIGRCILPESKHGDIYLYIGVFDKKRSTIVHELTHAVIFMLPEYGFDIKDSGGELACYLNQYLYEELESYFLKSKK